MVDQEAYCKSGECLADPQNLKRCGTQSKLHKYTGRYFKMQIKNINYKTYLQGKDSKGGSKLHRVCENLK